MAFDTDSMPLGNKVNFDETCEEAKISLKQKI